MKRFILILLFSVQSIICQANDVQKLVNAMTEHTPIINDLRQLTDEIGSRLTGTAANEKSLDWALSKFKKAGVKAHKETFEMPRAWVEHQALGIVSGDSIDFTTQVATMPFTSATKEKGLVANIIDLGKGDARAFKQAKQLKNSWLLIETALLDDQAGIHGLFQEYLDFVGIEKRAQEAGATGIIYMSSRPKNLLYRHLPSKGADNKLPIIVIEREQALKIQRLLAHNHQLSFTAKLDISNEASYQTANVIAEIKGSQFPDEIVLIGAHIDSFDLGTGALDNGSNVSLVIDIARQMTRLNIRPKRTIRFALFNGEEQGLFGSWAYTKQHNHELSQHMIASTIDIGTGKITGFFTNGRAEVIPVLQQVLNPVKSLGPFEHVNHPVVGTDNYDFMMNGVANLVANQKDANYASNYHAESDTFEKVDQQQLKLNAAVMAAMTLGFANLDNIPWQQQNSQQIETMVKQFDIETSMKTFGLYKSWKNKTRPAR
ncbi:peptidase M28 [Thalassotalea insulae]|uniref:Carboxypeptidase Q n=1 Tax=Thalassotalea insulae TaxID=2056778 RepID=A0ABQ6GW90_9GAMM|nr:M28 family peptidase [Thalassotalea insulae]GLX80127.1 peptidase M28 [Thalassotalea insulae]